MGQKCAALRVAGVGGTVSLLNSREETAQLEYRKEIDDSAIISIINEAL